LLGGMRRLLLLRSNHRFLRNDWRHGCRRRLRDGLNDRCRNDGLRLGCHDFKDRWCRRRHEHRFRC